MAQATGFWAIALEGEEFDLSDWRDAFQPPGDLQFIDHPEGSILRWRKFDQAGSAEDVNEQAKILMPQLNAVMAITRDTEPVRLAGVVEIDADGTYHRYAFVEGQHFRTFRLRRRAVGTVGSSGGKALTQPPQPSSQQQWIALAQASDRVAVALREALNFLSRGDNWFDLNKALECLATIHGGENRFRNLEWVRDSKSETDRLSRTANHFHRHASEAKG